MTIPATPSEVPYAGDGITVAFPIPFVFDTSADIKVILTSSTGTPAELATGFSITGGGGSTGTCTMDVAPAVNEILTVLDDPALTQTADYTANDSFPAEAHEAALDRTERQVKRLHQRVGRSIRVADGDDSSGNNLLLPVEAARAGRFLAFDAGGRPIASSGTGGGDAALRVDLASTVVGVQGARLAGYRRAEGSAVARSVYDVINERGMSVKDFGAVGSGLVNDAPFFAFAVSAISTARDIYVPHGVYRFDSEVLINKSNLRIHGCTGAGANLSAGGSRITLAAAAGAGAAALRTSTFQESIIIERLEIVASNLGQAQKCLRFAELRSSMIRDNWLEGTSNVADDGTAIQFDGTGTYTGDVDVVSNYITNHKFGVDLQGVCTTVRVKDNEMYGTAGHATNRGIKVASTCIANFASGNTLQGWNRGVYTEGIGFRQELNYFEANTVNWEWVHVGGNVFGASIGDIQISGGTPIYPRNNTDGCYQIGVSNVYFGSAFVEASLGFRGYGRTFNESVWQEFAFACTGSGTLTFTAVTASTVVGDNTKIIYKLDGDTLTVSWMLGGTIGGAGAELRIALPAGALARGRKRSVVQNFEAGANKFGVAETQNGDAFIRVFKTEALSGNWTAGAGETHGSHEMRVTGV